MPRSLSIIAGLVVLAATPPQAKWEGPWIPLPTGGRARTTFYYGPWRCTQEWLNDCNARCIARGHVSQGCIWLADLKTEYEGSVIIADVVAGGRFSFTHC